MLNAELRERIATLSTPLLADALVRLQLPEGHLDAGIRPVVPFMTMVGPAVTARLEVAEQDSADLSPLLDAYRSPPEQGGIIVIEIPVELHRYGIFGEGAATLARQNGYVGALVEGAVRDTADLQRMQFPTFSRIVTPGYIVGKASVGSIGEPVTVGGQTVRTGDAVVADNDGVIVIRGEEAELVVEKASAIWEWEQRAHQALAEGGGTEAIDRLAGPMP